MASDTAVLAELATDEGVWDSLGALIKLVPRMPDELILDYGEYEALEWRAKAGYLHEFLEFILTDEFYDDYSEIAGVVSSVIAMAYGIPLPPQLLSMLVEGQMRLF